MSNEPEALMIASYWERRAKELQLWIDDGEFTEFGYTPEGLRQEQINFLNTAGGLRRLHEINAELVEALMRMKYERGFACDCGIENSTWDFVDVALAKATGE